MTANVTLTNYLLLKRANTSVSSTYTGLVGEITIDTDLDTVRVHDGVTAGGHILANVSQINSNINLSAVNANVAAANLTIASTNANIGAFQTYANIEFTDLWANAATQTIALDNFIAGTGFATSANLGAYQIFANANIGAYQNYANVTFAELSANLGNLIVGTGFVTQTQLINNVNIISANVGSFQIFSNANAAIQSQALFQANIDHAANAIAANALISALQTNAAVQQTQITALDANIGSIITGTGFASLDQLNANVGILNTKLRVNVEIISANLGAYQIFANANSIAQSNSIDILLANAGTQATLINSLNANIGSYQTFANANVVAIQANLGVTQIWANSNIATINANLGAYQTYANTSSGSLQANLGAYQTYANANAASQTNELNNLLANAGVQATSINLVNANVTAANSAITTLTANAATQASLITTVNANVTAANAAIASLQSNAAVQQGVLDVLSGNAVTQTLELQQLTSNAAVQAANLTVLLANAVSQQNSLTVLVSNAATQSTAIDSINANVGAYQTFANANAATQATSITTLLSNAVAQAQSLDSLTANAATQGASIINIDANLGTATTNITALQANAGAQGSAIDNINANVGAYQTFANANAATQASSLTTLIANAVAQSLSLDSLASNAATQAAAINSINANVGAYQTYANANAATQATSITSLVANAATQQLQIDSFVTGTGFALVTQLTANVDTINANLGAFQTYANANAAGQTTEINSLRANITAANILIPNLSAVSGNILPSANVTYSLGSETRQWRDLWVSNNTIYIGNTPVRVDGGTLLVNGAPVGGTYGNTQVAAYLPTYTGNIAGNIVKNGNVWTFGTNGTTTFPTNISIDYSGGNVQYPRIIADSGKAFSVQAQGNIGSAALSWTVDPDSAGQYAAVAVTKVGGDNLAKVILQAQSDSGDAATAKTWVFNETGSLTFPTGNLVITPDDPAGNIASIVSTDHQLAILSTGANGAVASLWIEDYANVGTSNIAAVYANPTVGSKIVRIAVGQNGSPGPNLWDFGTTGNLTLPQGGNISEGGGISGAIRLTPAGGANSNQALVIYPTGNAEGDHVHLTAGGGSTELYLGNDYHYVKLVDGGNIELRAATANLSSQAAWTFDTTGNVDTIQALGIKVPNGVPTNVAVINSTTGSWEANPNLSLATTGGSGTGLTVNVAETGGYASTIEIATAGTGYNNGDLITVTSGTSNATFTIVIAGRNTWQFGTDAKLTLPNGAVIKDTAFDAIAFGQGAGQISQDTYAVAIGTQAGYTTQNVAAVAVGSSAGQTNQGPSAVAIGSGAGATDQSGLAVAIGQLAGSTTQGVAAVAIGSGAGRTSQGNYSIILNATGANLNATTANTFTVAPVRNDVANVAQVMFYNTTSKEITYGNTISIAGNINAGQFNFANGVNILSTVGASAYGNTQVASYLLNFDGDIEFTSSTAKIGNVDVITVGDHIRSPAYQFSNGASIFTGITGTYSNTNVAAYLTTATITTTGNITAGNLTTSGNISATGSILATPAWTSAGAITLTATTTNPTKGTTTSDNISYRQLGAKQWEVVMTYIQTVADGVNGSGDYLVTLPNGLSFDTTLPSQQIYTTNIGTNTYALMSYIIPSGSGLINNDTLGGQVYPIVYDATKFRILTTTYGSAIQCWGSGYYSLGGDDPKIQLTFRFTST